MRRAHGTIDLSTALTLAAVVVVVALVQILPNVGRQAEAKAGASRIEAWGWNIAGASLYNTFGDKRSLYVRALSRYLDQSFRERIRRIEPSLPPRDAIVAFLQEIVKRSLTDKQRRGCMQQHIREMVKPTLQPEKLGIQHVR